VRRVAKADGRRLLALVGLVLVVLVAFEIPWPILRAIGIGAIGLSLGVALWIAGLAIGIRTQRRR